VSINLTLVFDRYGFSRDSLLAFERMRLDWQDYEAFDRLKEDAIPLQNGVDWYGDEGLRHTTTDDYGAPLTYVAAHTLAKHLSAAPLQGWDAAALAFLKALPQDTKVVLWWN
jgi:hypothetical protein